MTVTVGLDIGVRQVRAVALRLGRGAPVVTGHAALSRFTEDGAERPLSTVVAELAATLAIGRPAAVASSELDVLARFLHLAPLPPSRLQRILRLELSPEESAEPPTIDAVRLASEGDDLCFLGLVAETAGVRLLQAELKRAGVRPQTISWGPIALAAAAAHVELPDGQLAMVVDIGAAGTDVALIGAGRLLACRRLAYGGDQFTQALVDGGLTQAEAERAKAAAPIMPDAGDPVPALELPSAPAPTPALDGEAELTLMLDDEAPPIRAPGVTTVAMGSLALGPQMTKAAEGLYGQLATTLAFFKAQLKRNQLAPNRVLLCGGGGGLRGLDGYLARRFQCPVERWDPCAGYGGDLPAEPWRWARAIGLALAAQPDAPRVDLRPEADLAREVWRRRLIWPWIAAACLVAAGVIAGLGLGERVERDRREADLLERAVAEHKRLSADLAKLEAERDAAREDLRAVAGRIHAARDLLWTVRALKEQTSKSKELWVTALETVGIGRDELADEGQTPPPPVSGSGSRITAGKPAANRRDSLIDRGAVDISGRVRFDVKMKDPDMVRYREGYQQALQEWTTPDGFRLFRDVRLTNTKVERFENTPKANADAGEFPFRFRCYFPATSLDGDAAPTVEKPAEAKP
jgi:Tfp pilus assembly PilM family ATPase